MNERAAYSGQSDKNDKSYVDQMENVPNCIQIERGGNKKLLALLVG